MAKTDFDAFIYRYIFDRVQDYCVINNIVQPNDIKNLQTMYTGSSYIFDNNLATKVD